jgi:hypothetical protein
MVVVRYAALAALVVWLGGTATTLVGDLFRQVPLAPVICAAVILVSMLILKFVGPPPRAFIARMAVAAAMLAVAIVAARRGATPITSTITLALGLVLLAWYAHE